MTLILDNSNDARHRIGVVGLGYVGAVTAACLAQLGHRVHGFERDPVKVGQLSAGVSPFYEPGLDDSLARAVNGGAGEDAALAIESEFHDAIEPLDMILICVGTPTQANGAHDVTQLERVCADLRTALCARPRTKPLMIAIRSTVPPGTTTRLRDEFFGGLDDVSLTYVPEFLREGTAIADFFDPPFVVVGADTECDAHAALAIFTPISAPRIVLAIRTAEMVKGVCNAFHALKAVFANETGALAAACGVDPEQLMSVITADTRLNISPAYLKPGFAFGGSCLPKDVRALNQLAEANGLSLPMYASILPSNDEHLARAAARVHAAGWKRVGMFGLSFKAKTDDMRESPALRLAAMLNGAQVHIRAFDADIRPEMLHGANLRALQEVFGDNVDPFARSPDELAHWADGVVLTKRIDAVTAAALRRANVPVVDLSRIESSENSLDLSHAVASNHQRIADPDARHPPAPAPQA